MLVVDDQPVVVDDGCPMLDGKDSWWVMDENGWKKFIIGGLDLAISGEEWIIISISSLVDEWSWWRTDLGCEWWGWIMVHWTPDKDTKSSDKLSGMSEKFVTSSWQTPTIDSSSKWVSNVDFPIIQPTDGNLVWIHHSWSMLRWTALVPSALLQRLRVWWKLRRSRSQSNLAKDSADFGWLVVDWWLMRLMIG